MFPKTRLGEKEHRKRKRELEIELIIQEISDLLEEGGSSKTGNMNILEIGSGDGFQIPYLEQIGNVVASDLYLSDDIGKVNRPNFCKCSITNAPFRDGYFDLIFSNHVLEHIEGIGAAFKELKRIGNGNCIYAFSIPTNLWLLLSIPAQYYNKIKWVFKELFLSSSPDRRERRGLFDWLLWFFLPKGHGCNTSFMCCYNSFRIEQWQRLLQANGFSIMKVKPLLLYGPSEWPIAPTKVVNKLNICSSALFLIKSEG